MNNSKINDGPFIAVAGGLGILFIGLKLFGVIKWSWLWVTAPFWGGIAIAILVLIGLGILAVVSGGK